MNRSMLVVLFLIWLLNETPTHGETDSTTDQEPSPVLSVMTWNIRYDNSRDGQNSWSLRKDWVASSIRKQKADIVGLQEALKRQFDYLKSQLPEYASYGVGRDDGKTQGEYVPILFRRSRFELLDRSTFWLSKTPDKPGSKDWDAAITRIATWVKLRDKKSNEIFFIVNTHFDHRGANARSESALLIRQMITSKFNKHPSVVMGDFNTASGTPPYQTLVKERGGKETLKDTRTASTTKPEGPDSTWNGFRAIEAKRRIDFIFVTDSVTVASHRTLVHQRDGRFASDHLAVFAEIAFGP